MVDNAWDEEAARTPDPPGGPAAQVEDNGAWWSLALFVIVFLFGLAAAAVVHSLIATFS